MANQALRRKKEQFQCAFDNLNNLIAIAICTDPIEMFLQFEPERAMMIRQFAQSAGKSVKEVMIALWEKPELDKSIQIEAYIQKVRACSTFTTYVEVMRQDVTTKLIKMHNRSGANKLLDDELILIPSKENPPIIDKPDRVKEDFAVLVTFFANVCAASDPTIPLRPIYPPIVWSKILNSVNRKDTAYEGTQTDVINDVLFNVLVKMVQAYLRKRGHDTLPNLIMALDYLFTIKKSVTFGKMFESLPDHALKHTKPLDLCDSKFPCENSPSFFDALPLVSKKVVDTGYRISTYEANKYTIKWADYITIWYALYRPDGVKDIGHVATLKDETKNIIEECRRQAQIVKVDQKDFMDKMLLNLARFGDSVVKREKIPLV